MSGIEATEKAMSDMTLSPCPFGHQMRDKHFLLAPTYTSLNHGAFGTYPKSVQKRLHEIQALAEARPDVFLRYQYPAMLGENRAAMAEFLGVPVGEVVFVPNATTAINVVLRSLKYEKGDVILLLSSVYGSVEKTVEYLRETTDVDRIWVPVQYPVDDEVLVASFQQTIKKAKKDGLNVKIASFDTISSLPGVRVPWERLVEVCRAEGVLSMVDGAHGIGHIRLDLPNVQPDFLTSNCHKWLYVPRGCAVLYVSERNQHLIRSSLPTSHGFEPLPRENEEEIFNPLLVAASGKSKFEMLFEFVGTLDVGPYLCIVEALRFRREVCGGEEKIMQHCEDLLREGASLGAKILGTEIMQNKEQTLTKCLLTNIELPIQIGEGEKKIPEKDTYKAACWMTAELAHEHDIFSPVYTHAGKFWTRWSGQIYLETEDYTKGADALKIMCERAKSGEYLEERLS